MDKAAACERVGLTFKSAKECGWVAERFPLPSRTPDATFLHHKKLAIQDLTKEQRAELLEKSSKNGWTTATLRYECGMQGAIGDWFNAIKGDRASARERAG